MKKIGIYVHIPFCNSKCFYCNFNSKVCSDDIKENYIFSLIKEIQNFNSNANNVVDTIFIGGGTPSTLKSGVIALILNTIKQKFNVLNIAEITVEANPNSLNSTICKEWYNAGVNRVSVGLQSSNDNILKAIGRTHTYIDYLKAMQNLKNAGIKNINTDIMIGLPKQKQTDVKHTIYHAFKSGATHISAYTLILEDNTPLKQMVESNMVKLPKEEKVVGMFNYVLKLMRFYGYNRYEVSNFALKDNVCIHNYNCWNMHEYVGFGAGAHSFYNGFRYNNISDIETYIKNINNNESIIEEKYELNNQEKFEETIMLGLRLLEGIDLKEIYKKYGINLLTTKKAEINELINLKLIKFENNKLSATESGFHVLNQIILKIV